MNTNPVPSEDFILVQQSAPVPTNGTDPGSILLKANEAAGTAPKETPTGKNVLFARTAFQFDNRKMFDPSDPTAYFDAVKFVMIHEIGHTLGLADVKFNKKKFCGDQTAGGSIMNGICTKNNTGSKTGPTVPNLPAGMTPCDKASIRAANKTTDPVSDNGDGCFACTPTGGGGGGGYVCGQSIFDDCDHDGYERWQDCDDWNGEVHPYDDEDEDELAEKCALFYRDYYWGDDISCDDRPEEETCGTVTVRIRTYSTEWLDDVPTIVGFRASNSQWMNAPYDGGYGVTATSNYNAWNAQLVLVDHDGGQLLNGDLVSIYTGSGWLFHAENGVLDARGEGIGDMETFVLIDLDNPADGVVRTEDQVALQTLWGYFVCAENGGGTVVVADRTEIGPWETFRISISNSPDPNPDDFIGTWNYNGDCSITGMGGNWVIVTNEWNESAWALLTDGDHIIAYDWGFLLGTLSPDKSTIDWHNGTSWVR